MRITPSRVHDKRTGVLAYSLGKRFGTVLDDDVAPTNGAGNGGIKWGAVFWVFAALEWRDDNLVLEARFALHVSSMLE